MVIMTLEVSYIFKDYIIKSACVQFASWNFWKIAEMIDIIVENTHTKNQWQLFRYKNDLYKKLGFCLIKKFLNLVCCSTCELLICKVLTKCPEENV